MLPLGGGGLACSCAARCSYLAARGHWFCHPLRRVSVRRYRRYVCAYVYITYVHMYILRPNKFAPM
jgi:hypothetical protein